MNIAYTQKDDMAHLLGRVHDWWTLKDGWSEDHFDRDAQRVHYKIEQAEVLIGDDPMDAECQYVTREQLVALVGLDAVLQAEADKSADMEFVWSLLD